MNVKADPLFRYMMVGCVILVFFLGENMVAASDPTINITGNDDNYVYGTVKDLPHPLRYEILVYVKCADELWYGPKTLGNDTFPEISPDLKWKCNYNPDFEATSDTAFKAYLIEKGVTTDQVLIHGARNLSLFYTNIIAQTEAERK